MARARAVPEAWAARSAIDSVAVTRGVLVGGKLVAVAVGEVTSVTCTTSTVGARVGMGWLVVNWRRPKKAAAMTAMTAMTASSKRPVRRDDSLATR